MEAESVNAEQVRVDLQEATRQLTDAKDQIQLLDKKYNKAKKLIKEFQHR